MHRIKAIGLVLIVAMISSGCAAEPTWNSVSIGDGMIFEYRMVNSGTTANFNGMAMRKGGNGVIVGMNGIMLVLSNNKWKRINTGSGLRELADACIDDSGDIWCAGVKLNGMHTASYMVHYDGRKVDSVRTPDVGYLNSIAVINKSGWSGGPAGYLLKYDGSKWTENRRLPDGIGKIRLDSPIHGWLISTHLWEYADGEWVVRDTDLPPTEALLILEPRKLLLGGIDYLSIYQDGGYSDIAGFDGRNVNSVAVYNENAFIAVGDDNADNGTVMFVVNGSKTNYEVEFPGMRYLTGISFDSSDHGWICGWRGTLIEFSIRKQQDAG